MKRINPVESFHAPARTEEAPTTDKPRVLLPLPSIASAASPIDPDRRRNAPGSDG
jgi:hypothetical protein